MLHATGNVQVVESQPTDVGRRNSNTGELAVILNVESAFASDALGTRVIGRVAGETGNALEVQKLVEEDLRVGGSDVRNQLEFFGA